MLRTCGCILSCLLWISARHIDAVCRSLLVRKLTAICFSHSLVIWIEAFLVDRIVRVSCGGALSSPRRGLSAVPKGSALGPLLFLIYVNSISNGIVANGMAFADDYKLLCFTICCTSPYGDKILITLAQQQLLGI